MNIIVLRFAFIFLLGYLITPLYAQQYKPMNEKTIEKADTFAAIYLRTSEDTFRKQALDIYLNLINAEKSTDSPDTQAIIHSEFKIGYIDMIWGEYKWGMQAFERMLKYTRRPKDDNTINAAIPYLGYCYRQTRLGNFTFKVPVFDKTERIEFYFPITYVYAYKKDTIQVKINFGTYDGIGLGTLGKVKGVKNDIISGHNNLFLGYCEVVDLAESEAVLKIFDFQGTDSLHQIFVGDMVRLPIQYPKRLKDIITKCLIDNSNFYNINLYPFYDYRQWYIHGSDSLEKEIILAMQADIHNAFLKLKDMKIEALEQVCTSGRFKDKTLLEALRITSKKDIKDFLYYSTFYSSFYFGSLSFFVKYSEWVVENTPVSYGEFKDAIENATTENELKAIASLYKAEVVAHDFFTYLGNEEEEMNDNNQSSRAFELNRRHIKVATFMNLIDQVGWGYFFKARMHNLRNQNDSVIMAYNNGLIYFKKSKDVMGEGYCIGNLASKYYELGDYKKSLEFYKKSYLIKSKIETTDESDYYKNVAVALHGIADSYNILSQFDSALNSYIKATVIYNKAASVDSRSRSLSAYTNIAKIYKKQGKYLEAVKAYELQQVRYKQLGDQKNVAETYDNLADALYSLNDYKKAADYYNRACIMKLSWGNKAGAGFSKANVGQALYNLGEYDLAIAAHDTAGKLREEGDDKAGVAFSYTQIGSLYKENGEYTKATAYLDKAYEIYKSLDDKSNLAGLLNKKGSMASKIGDNTAALKYYHEALDMYNALGDKIEVANSYYNISGIYTKQTKLRTALSYLDTALAIQNETGDQSGQMFTLKYMGTLTELEYKDNKKAMALYQQALTLAKATGSPYNEALCLYSIGSLYESNGEFSKSKPYLDSCYRIYVRIKDRFNQTYALVNIGFHYCNLGKFQEGEKKFNEALNLAKEIKNNDAIANAYAALGSIGRVTGDIPSAIDYLSKSIDINTKAGNLWGIASNYIDMGNIYNEQSKYSVAVNYYLKADSFYNSIHSEYLRSTPLNNAGTIFYHQGNYDSSLTYFYPTLEILKRMEPEGDFINLVTINIGEVFVMKNDYTEAEKWLNQGLANSMKREEKRNKGIALRTVAKYNIKRQKYKLAEEQIFQALAIVGDSGEIENTTDIYNQIGRVKYELKEYQTATEWFHKTIKKSEPIGFLKFLYEAYFYSALSYKALKQNDTALRHIKRAIEVMEKISGQITGGAEAQKKFTSGDLQQKMYETIVEWLLEQGKIEEAISYLEKGNNEALNAKFKQLRGEGKKSENNETQKALSEAEQKQIALEKLNAQIVKEKSKPVDQQKKELIKKLEANQQIGQKEYKNFVQDLVKKNPKIQVYISNSVNPDDFRAEKKNIAPDMAVLLYLMAEKNLYIFCATKDSVFAKIVPIESAELSKKIMTVYNVVRNPGFLPTTKRGSKIVNAPKFENPEKVLNDLSKELYDMLIGSVKAEIGSKTRLAIIPNGDLFYLPFHALIAKEEQGKLTYLMDEFSIQYSSRLKFLGSTHSVDLNYFLPLVIGNPDKSLPNAEIEVNDIQRLFPKALVLIGDKATKAELYSRSANYNVLHFATHGVMDYNNFDSSYLLMAQDVNNKDDGHFTLNDISELEKIDEYSLVVLSACETAVKQDLVEGWPQTTASAFLTAGVETVFGSLWQVDDKSTQIIMSAFYDNILNQKLSKRDALHQAQLAVSKLKGFGHPYYWASFAYYGE